MSRDLLFKVLLIGDRAAGKTSLLVPFRKDSSIGIDFKVQTFTIDGKTVKLQIWDTTGSERFKTIASSYYRGAKGVMLVYDVTQEESFNNIWEWIRDVNQHAPSDVVMMVLGNKCDMEDQRQVSKERGEKLAADFGIKFMETSPRSGTNVEEAFTSLARDIVTRLNRKTEEEKLQNTETQPGGCEVQ